MVHKGSLVHLLEVPCHSYVLVSYHMPRTKRCRSGQLICLCFIIQAQDYILMQSYEWKWCESLTRLQNICVARSKSVSS